MQDEAVTEKIIGCAMRVHQVLGPGFLESVYENALAHELRKEGLEVERQLPIRVMYDGVPVGDFIADMLVVGRVLVENKAVMSLAVAHEVQLVNYLTATGHEIGLFSTSAPPVSNSNASTAPTAPRALNYRRLRMNTQLNNPNTDHSLILFENLVNPVNPV